MASILRIGAGGAQISITWILDQHIKHADLILIDCSAAETTSASVDEAVATVRSKGLHADPLILLYRIQSQVMLDVPAQRLAEVHCLPAKDEPGTPASPDASQHERHVLSLLLGTFYSNKIMKQVSVLQGSSPCQRWEKEADEALQLRNKELPGKLAELNWTALALWLGTACVIDSGSSVLSAVSKVLVDSLLDGAAEQMPHALSALSRIHRATCVAVFLRSAAQLVPCSACVAADGSAMDTLALRAAPRFPRLHALGVAAAQAALDAVLHAANAGAESPRYLHDAAYATLVAAVVHKVCAPPSPHPAVKPLPTALAWPKRVAAILNVLQSCPAPVAPSVLFSSLGMVCQASELMTACTMRSPSSSSSSGGGGGGGGGKGTQILLGLRKASPVAVLSAALFQIQQGQLRPAKPAAHAQYWGACISHAWANSMRHGQTDCASLLACLQLGFALAAPRLDRARVLRALFIAVQCCTAAGWWAASQHALLRTFQVCAGITGPMQSSSWQCSAKHPDVLLACLALASPAELLKAASQPAAACPGLGVGAVDPSLFAEADLGLFPLLAWTRLLTRGERSEDLEARTGVFLCDTVVAWKQLCRSVRLPQRALSGTLLVNDPALRLPSSPAELTREAGVWAADTTRDLLARLHPGTCSAVRTARILCGPAACLEVSGLLAACSSMLADAQLPSAPGVWQYHAAIKPGAHAPQVRAICEKHGWDSTPAEARGKLCCAWPGQRPALKLSVSRRGGANLASDMLAGRGVHWSVCAVAAPVRGSEPDWSASQLTHLPAYAQRGSAAGRYDTVVQLDCPDLPGAADGAVLVATGLRITWDSVELFARLPFSQQLFFAWPGASMLPRGFGLQLACKPGSSSYTLGVTAPRELGEVQQALCAAAGLYSGTSAQAIGDSAARVAMEADTSEGVGGRSWSAQIGAVDHVLPAQGQLPGWQLLVRLCTSACVVTASLPVRRALLGLSSLHAVGTWSEAAAYWHSALRCELAWHDASQCWDVHLCWPGSAQTAALQGTPVHVSAHAQLPADSSAAFIGACPSCTMWTPASELADLRLHVGTIVADAGAQPAACLAVTVAYMASEGRREVRTTISSSAATLGSHA